MSLEVLEAVAASICKEGMGKRRLSQGNRRP